MKRSGFTLIELLVVISIIALLSSVVLSSLSSARSKARDARRISDLKQIETALALYRNDNGRYPRSTSCDTATGSWCSSYYLDSNNNWIKDLGSSAGLTTYLPIQPTDPTAANIALNTRTPGAYWYFSNGSCYIIKISLEQITHPFEIADRNNSQGYCKNYSDYGGNEGYVITSD